MKIALGSAQFGLNYGINNKKGIISKLEVNKILDYSKSVNIDTIDTAQAYGKSEKVIGEYESRTDFNIISKISFNENEDVNKLLNNSLLNLKIDKLYGLLLHSFDNYIRNPSLLDRVIREKENGKMGKIGFSLYYPHELKYLFEKNVAFDLVQVPYSIFDRRFEPEFAMLKEKGIEIHARSLFLQGLVFMSPDSLSKQFDNIKTKIQKLRDISISKNISLTSIALNFVLNNEFIDKAVIGIDSLEQLQENVTYLDEKEKVENMNEEIKDLIINDENILLPFNWKLGK